LTFLNLWKEFSQANNNNCNNNTMIGICVNLISFSQAYSISAFSISVNDGAGHSVFHVADVCGQTVWCWVLWLGLGNEK
jgi:hypothetical protein